MNEGKSLSQQVSWLRNALIGSLVALALGGSVMGYLLHEESVEVAELKTELRLTEDELTEVKADYYDLEQSAGNIEELEEENESLENKVEGLQATVDEQEVEIASLEAALSAYSSGSSGSGGSSGSSGGSGSTTSSTSDTQSVKVYITNSGSKYHKNGFQYLRESKNNVTLTQAKSWGYTACSRCY